MTMRLLDENDLPWVSEALDVVVGAAGKPWRVALERLDDTRRIEQPTAPVRFAAVVGAMQRILGGRARNAALARTARALALGAPALTAAQREARIAYAAQELEVTCAAVENLLWSDLPRERPVELPRGRPSELEVAAVANVQLLQRAVRRAQSVTVRVWGDAGSLVRAAARRGLLTTLSVRAADAGGDARVTVLDIVGPLALFHRTAVYGRALADLVPLFADCERFELEMTARGREQFYTIEIASPVLLPAVPTRLAVPAFDLQRLLKALEREVRSVAADGPAIAITPHVPAIHSGSSLVCPDLVLQRGERRVYVEIVGFWTREFLERKLALYRAAGVEVVLCIDDSRGCSEDDLPDNLPVLRYARRITAVAPPLVLRMLPGEVFAGRAL